MDEASVERAMGQASCPVPRTDDGERVTLAHGEGGRLMRRLIGERIVPELGNDLLAPLGDAARLPRVDGELAFTTDSFVVSPLFFPGGDIGSLAVFGTVNDLAVSGARPRWITLSLIIEEGLLFSVLQRVLRSVAAAARRAGITVVAGDTKVVPIGAADGLFINTAGVGELVEPVPPGPEALEVGDELIVSGPIGRHGIAVMAAREQLALEPPPASDSAPLVSAVEALRRAKVPLRAIRDATRGGVAAVLHEWAGASSLTLSIDDECLPVTAEVRGACELLGLDALHVANEGTMVVAVETGAAEAALAVLGEVPETSAAAAIGRVAERGVAPVTVNRTLAAEQPLDEPPGAPLPRIC